MSISEVGTTDETQKEQVDESNHDELDELRTEEPLENTDAKKDESEQDLRLDSKDDDTNNSLQDELMNDVSEESSTNEPTDQSRDDSNIDDSNDETKKEDQSSEIDVHESSASIGVNSVDGDKGPDYMRINENGSNHEDEANSSFSDIEDSNEEFINELRNISITGSVNCDWTQLQKILTNRLELVLNKYIQKSEKRGNKYTDEKYQEPNVEKFELENSRKEILHLISSFSEPPFTIQRICELLYSPFIYYDKVSTFLRGLEKNLRVS